MVIPNDVSMAAGDADTAAILSVLTERAASVYHFVTTVVEKVRL